MAVRAVYDLYPAPSVPNLSYILYEGYRCRISDMKVVDGVARYTLNSAPCEGRDRKLPPGYEGMRSGGNESVLVCVERFERIRD